jgi:hypothetical protein
MEIPTLAWEALETGLLSQMGCGLHSGQARLGAHSTRLIRTASCMEQVNAPARAYHQKMKREQPVTCCTKCGGAGYNMRVANGRCCKTSGEQRCSGINAIAVETFDWSECKLCQATGYYRNKECPNCKGAGYLFVGLKDKATTTESVTFR